MKHVDIINFHLSEHKESFLYSLYEEKFFKIEKFHELIQAIKLLKKENDILFLLEEKFDNCIGNSFIANLFSRLHLLLNIEGDLREYKQEFNITNIKYSEYIEELIQEIQSIFFND